ncbi:hypothetical protein [Sphingomonas solaris]|uniref:Uncharacterized protein n=1 Tax=Alterirhizorhabdus solaris TaxID=2529389 RepID=A0A558QV51_9SPHN|nr:hypothetical protein [Sphingomonas solaris]TVV71026.1 hypothetical protein FOY91_17750 [Sphingomonas solaris]
MANHGSMLRGPGLVITAAMIVMPPAGAQTPGGLGDLVGARGSSAELDLRSRGYALSGNKDGSPVWWNKAKSSCVLVYVDDGRVQSIRSVKAKDCGKGGSGNAVAAVAIGAILAGAIIAGSSGDKHRDHDDDFGDDRNRGRHSYSPADGVTCYRRESTCYKYGDFSAKWTRREF